MRPSPPDPVTSLSGTPYGSATGTRSIRPTGRGSALTSAVSTQPCISRPERSRSTPALRWRLESISMSSDQLHDPYVGHGPARYAGIPDEPEPTHSTEVRRWADEAMYSATPLVDREAGELLKPRVTIISMTHNPLRVMAAAAQQYRGI